MQISPSEGCLNNFTKSKFKIQKSIVTKTLNLKAFINMITHENLLEYDIICTYQNITDTS